MSQDSTTDINKNNDNNKKTIDYHKLEKKITPHLLRCGVEERRIKRVFLYIDQFKDKLLSFIEGSYNDYIHLYSDLTPEQWENLEKIFGMKNMPEQIELKKLAIKVKKGWENMIKEYNRQEKIAQMKANQEKENAASPPPNNE